MRAVPAGSKPERGQALVEFLVLCGCVLVPLFLLLPLLGKFQDIQHQTQLASRYVAFEATAQSQDEKYWKPAEQINREVANRFYALIDGPIISNQPAAVQPYWRWSAPGGGNLVGVPSVAVTVRTGIQGEGKEIKDGFSPEFDFFSSPEFRAGGYQPEAVGLSAPGLYSATVQVALANLPARNTSRFGSSLAPFDRLNLRIAARTATFTAPWTAKDPQEVVDRMLTQQDSSSHGYWIFPAQYMVVEDEQIYTTARLKPIVQAIEALSPNVSAPLLGYLDYFRDVVPKEVTR